MKPKVLINPHSYSLFLISISLQPSVHTLTFLRNQLRLIIEFKPQNYYVFNNYLKFSFADTNYLGFYQVDLLKDWKKDC